MDGLNLGGTSGSRERSRVSPSPPIGFDPGRFTPGPWASNIALLSNGSVSVARVVGPDRAAVALLCNHSDKQTTADAHLIAAAPELFNELTEWLFLFDSGQITGAGLHAFAEKTRAALAKARGEQA